MQLFENTVKLRGYLGNDPEVPAPDANVSDSHILLTLLIESSKPDKETGGWVVRAVEISVVCSAPDFGGVTPDMQEGDYVEIKGEVDVIDSVRSAVVAGEHYPVIRHFLIIRALQVRKLHIPTERSDG